MPALQSQVANIPMADFTYPLPPERIAQQPVEPREAAKLLVWEKGELHDAHFTDLPTLLSPSSLLILNDTRVIHARLEFRKPQGGRVEVFLLEPHCPSSYEESFSALHSCSWRCLIGNAKRWHTDPIALTLPSGTVLQATRDEHEGNGIVRLSWASPLPFGQLLQQAGAIPIPPYLKRDATPEDSIWYQTVFARASGSVAAPTAGLHFSDALLQSIAQAGHTLGYSTLHVGAGTFLPVKSPCIGGHAMHRESIAVPRATILKLLEHPGPIIPVGTTALRTIESLYWIGYQLLNTPQLPVPLGVGQWLPYQAGDTPAPQRALEALLSYLDSTHADTLHATTNLLIAPGYTPRIAHGLITNFHQPESTLLLLVACFMGTDWRRAYQHALAHGYRFLSYGDGMLILP